MKDLAFGGAYWVVDVEATSLIIESKEFFVDLEPSLSTISYGDNTSKLKGIGSWQGDGNTRHFTSECPPYRDP
jgi:hypothetical protein